MCKKADFRRDSAGNCEKSHRVVWLLFSTHHSDAAIMLRLIFRNVFGMILTTGNVILIQKASWFCEANNQRLPELTEHCDFLR
ncbi:MAG TPA: hypothetical protein DEQ39_19575 [Atlantibacter hermannii]|nr:hypothetical protein SR38_20140 [Atlantibacter hermannii]HAI50847.1 hypothetical protein [Enterobacteriaceae bacterium]HAP79990.1 hypothetical protein [Enterobacteriaceae bacterium]HCC13057.1 hypothetical protein [Atlantibacter hermannii]